MDTKSFRGFTNKLILTCFLIVVQFPGLRANSDNSILQDYIYVSADSGNPIKVALLQISPIGANIQANLKKGDQYCRKAKSLGADIVLFPEMWNIGYSGLDIQESDSLSGNYFQSIEKWKARAVDIGSEYLVHFQRLAAELKITIVISYLEKWDGLPRNSASVIDEKGNILMTYSKVHTCDFLITEANCTPGDDFYVCDVPINGDKIKLGIMICYDREFPESARILMLKGAEIILTPNACGLDEQRINQFQSRAYENAVGVAMTNYPGPFQNGHSCSFDCNGDKIFIADESEGVFITKFDMNKIRSYRNTTINGNAYRRPKKYDLIISEKVDSVFKRNNASGEVFIREKR